MSLQEDLQDRRLRWIFDHGTMPLDGAISHFIFKGGVSSGPEEINLNMINYHSFLNMTFLIFHRLV